MLVMDLAGLIRRRYPIVLLGLICTTFALVGLREPTTLFFGTSSAMVLSPQSPRPADRAVTNVLQTRTPSALDAASVAAVKINGGNIELKSASPSATLYGLGESAGTSAHIRTMGGQWAPWLVGPIIDIQVLGPTAEEALATLRAQRADVADTQSAFQSSTQTPTEARMTVSLFPAEPSVSPVSSSRSRALAATLLGGILTTVAAAYWVDRLRHVLRDEA
jgi:hypothetical protein